MCGHDFILIVFLTFTLMFCHGNDKFSSIFLYGCCSICYFLLCCCVICFHISAVHRFSYFWFQSSQCQKKSSLECMKLISNWYEKILMLPLFIRKNWFHFVWKRSFTYKKWYAQEQISWTLLCDMSRNTSHERQFAKIIRKLHA